MNRRTEELLKDFRHPNEIKSLSYLKERLDARRRYPVQYNALKDAHEAREREALDRADALKVWIRQGRNESDFEREWVKMSTEARSSKLREAQQAAHDAMWRQTKAGF